MHNVQFISVGGSRRRDGGRGEDDGGEEGNCDGRGEEKSDAMRRSSVVTDKNILSRRGQTIKQCRARIREYARAHARRNTCPWTDNNVAYQ